MWSALVSALRQGGDAGVISDRVVRLTPLLLPLLTSMCFGEARVWRDLAVRPIRYGPTGFRSIWTGVPREISHTRSLSLRLQQAKPPTRYRSRSILYPRVSQVYRGGAGLGRTHDSWSGPNPPKR
jgi:hypothetical protein